MGGWTLHGTSFCTDLTTVGDRGGAGFVVEALDRVGGEPQLVAEAGYERLAKGDGELAMAAASPNRGRVERLLLDALLETAAATGVAEPPRRGGPPALTSRRVRSSRTAWRQPLMERGECRSVLGADRLNDELTAVDLDRDPAGAT